MRRQGTAKSEKEGMDMEIQKTLQNQTKETVSPSARARSRAVSLYTRALSETTPLSSRVLSETPSSSRALSETSSSFGHTSQKSQIDTFERTLFTQPQTDSTKAAADHSSSALNPFGADSLQSAGMQSAAAGGLSFNGELPSTNLLKIKDNLPKDDIDWTWMALRMNRTITSDNADNLTREVDTVVSSYVAAKSHLEQVYAGHEDLLHENMTKLETMFSRAKQQLTSSYEQNIGSFYERLGNAGIKKEMGESFSAAIDRRVQEMENQVKESGIMEREGANSFTFIEFSLDAKSLLAWEKGEPTASSLEKGDEKYNLNDLQAAGIVTKTALSMNTSKPHLMNDNELGIHLAARYGKISEWLSHMGISKEMIDFLQGAFSDYMHNYTFSAFA